MTSMYLIYEIYIYDVRIGLILDVNPNFHFRGKSVLAARTFIDQQKKLYQDLILI